MEINGVFVEQSVVNRFYDRITVRKDGCWEIDYAKDKDGYSRFSVRYQGESTFLGAHRFMYMIHHENEDITDLEVCHTCDHPWCVNPDHLFADTHQENVADCVRKNRQSKGSSLPQSVLTEENIINILNGIISCEYTSIKQIANHFCVTHVTILWLVHEKSWKHITKDYDMVAIRKIIINPTTVSGKLTPDNVRDIRKRLANGETQASIARIHGIDNSVVRKIRRNEIHKNII